MVLQASLTTAIVVSLAVSVQSVSGVQFFGAQVSSQTRALEVAANGATSLQAPVQSLQARAGTTVLASAVGSYCAAPRAVRPPQHLLDSGLQLVQVQLVTRHGKRASIGEPYPLQLNGHHFSCALNPELQATASAWPQLFQVVNLADGVALPSQPSLTPSMDNGDTCLPGELTPGGLQQAMDLGRSMRSAYAEVLHPPLGPTTKVFVRSTDVNRTIGTAVGVLSQFLGNATLQRMQPVQINVVQDAMDIMTGDTDCARADQISGPTRTLLTNPLIGICDAVREPACDGAQLPCVEGGRCMNVSQFSMITNLADQAFEQFFGKVQGGVAARLRMLPLMRDIVGNMQTMASQNTSNPLVATSAPEVAMYSGHDVTIAPLSAALGFFSAEWPRIASNIIFELWRSPNASTSVRVVYNDRTVTQHVPGCGGGELCSLEVLQQSLTNWTGGSASYAKACQASGI